MDGRKDGGKEGQKEGGQGGWEGVKGEGKLDIKQISFFKQS